MSAFVSNTLPIFQLILAFCNLCVLLYAFKGFITKPQNSLKEDVEELKVWKKTVETWRTGCSIRFENQDKSHRVTQKALLALIDKEVEDQVAEGKSPAKELVEARQDLYQHLFDK